MSAASPRRCGRAVTGAATHPLAVLPANQDLTAAEVRLLAQASGREQRLRVALEPIRNYYDLIVIDCPPALNMLTVNALVAADSVIIPMQCEYYALEGLIVAGGDHRADPSHRQSETRDRGHAAHHVRPAQQSRQ